MPKKSTAKARRNISFAAYVEAAQEKYEDEGTCEIDDNATVSISEDGGAYVQAWVWVYDSEVPKKTKV
jgi:hypothetical protein